MNKTNRKDGTDTLIFLVGACAGASLVGILLVIRVIFCGWEGLINP